MKKLFFVLLLLLVSLFLFGCGESDPVSVAKENNVVKVFLADHENAKLKSGFFDSKDIVFFEKEISKNCLGVSIQDGLYRVSFADFNSKVVLNVWLNEGGTQVLCSYKSKLTSGEKIVCLSGTKFNVDSNKCESKPDINFVCSIGVYNSVSLKCEFVPQIQATCSTGIFNSDLNKCEYVAQVVSTCAQGVYNSVINSNSISTASLNIE